MQVPKQLSMRFSSAMTEQDSLELSREHSGKIFDLPASLNIDDKLDTEIASEASLLNNYRQSREFGNLILSRN